MKKELTPEVAATLIGKLIKWNAPAYKANKPYSGVAIINMVEKLDRRPLHCTCVGGDDLNYAFNEWTFRDADKPLCYSDGDRYVEYEVIEV